MTFGMECVHCGIRMNRVWGTCDNCAAALDRASNRLSAVTCELLIAPRSLITPIKGEKKMAKIYIRSLTADNVSVHLENGVLLIKVGNLEEIKAEQQDDGTWVLWDTGEYIGVFENFQEVWSHVKDLATHYRLFSQAWQSEYYDTLCTLFRNVK